MNPSAIELAPAFLFCSPLPLRGLWVAAQGNVSYVTLRDAAGVYMDPAAMELAPAGAPKRLFYFSVFHSLIRCLWVEALNSVFGACPLERRRGHKNPADDFRWRPPLATTYGDVPTALLGDTSGDAL